MRIGSTHKKLAELHAAGDFPARRVVVEASRFRHQRELVVSLRESGAEIVLDTEAAELAAPGRHASHARRAPWALEDGTRPLGPDNYRGASLAELMGTMARFAVEHDVQSILAPSHYLGDTHFGEWRSIDRDACFELRKVLDREGGGGIGIDFPVILPNIMLNDTSMRGEIINGLADLPVENVWIRASGFGSDAGPLATKRYLSAISGFHNLGKPVVADCLGGLVGMAALAFGAISGIALGIGERERFDAGDWNKEPKPVDEDTRFGRAVRVTIPGLYRSVTLKELDLLVSARGGRRIVTCGDRTCCPHGHSDMTNDPRGHMARQLFRSVSALEEVPDLRREEYFISEPLAHADRRAREIKALRPLPAEAARIGVDTNDLMRRMGEHSHRIEKLRASFENLHETRGDEKPRARPIETRKDRDGSKSAQAQP